MFGSNGGRPTASTSTGLSSSSGKPFSKPTTTPQICTATTQAVSLTPRQPLDILRSFLLYYLWSERCRKHFDGLHSLKRVLLQAWEATTEVGMATWRAIRSSSCTRNQDRHDCIEQAFRAEWLHGHIFGEGDGAILWRMLPPLYFLNFSNE